MPVIMHGEGMVITWEMTWVGGLSPTYGEGEGMEGGKVQAQARMGKEERDEIGRGFISWVVV